MKKIVTNHSFFSFIFFPKASWHPQEDWIAVGVYPPQPSPPVEANLAGPGDGAKVAFFDVKNRTRVTDFHFDGQVDIATFNVFSRDGSFMLTTGVNSRDLYQSKCHSDSEPARKSNFFLVFPPLQFLKMHFFLFSQNLKFVCSRKKPDRRLIFPKKTFFPTKRRKEPLPVQSECDSPIFFQLTKIFSFFPP